MESHKWWSAQLPVCVNFHIELISKVDLLSNCIYLQDCAVRISPLYIEQIYMCESIVYMVRRPYRYTPT